LRVFSSHDFSAGDGRRGETGEAGVAGVAISV
jgi:hypothetical protein